MSKRWFYIAFGCCLFMVVAGCTTPPPSQVVVLPNFGLKTPPPPPEPDVDVFRVDIGRTPETAHPIKEGQEMVNQINDRIRAVTGLPIDLFAFEDGGRWVMTSRAPAMGKAALLDPATGAAIVNFYQLSGLPPRARYMQVLNRPNANEVLQRPIQFLPAADPAFSAANVSLPDPEFGSDALDAALPDANLTGGGGIYQINDLIRIELSFVPQVGKAVDPATDRLSMVVTGVVLPDLCGWKGIETCPHPATPIQNRKVEPLEVLAELEKLVQEKRDEGEEITPAIFDELFERITFDVDGATFNHFKAGNRSWYILATSGGTPKSAGCGCRIGGQPAPLGRQLRQIGMALLAFAPILWWRRRHRTSNQ